MKKAKFLVFTFALMLTLAVTTNIASAAGCNHSWVHIQSTTVSTNHKVCYATVGCTTTDNVLRADYECKYCGATDRYSTLLSTDHTRCK